MDELNQIRIKKEEILNIASKHGAINIRIFGSIVRGESRPGSDIDFLIDTESKTSPLFPAGLILDLEELLGKHVEIVTERALNPFCKDNVLHEEILL